MRTQALAAFAAGALALGTCATTGAPPRGQGFPVWERTLPSGMQVVVEQDATATVAGVVLIVDVGSADDPAGKPGLAHALEHLVFRAPDDAGLSMATRLGRRAAASFNATTGIERTTYFVFAPSRSLDDLVAILLARMADPLRGATDALLAKEASTIADELRLKQGASGTEVLMPALLPPGHPHARAFASWRQTAPLSLADLRAFAAQYYRPERMTLVISGPITEAWKTALWDKIPATLHGREGERRAPVRRGEAPFAAPARADADLQVVRASVDSPELWMAWRLPPAQGIAANKLEVMARVAEQVLSGRIQHDDSADVLDVDTWALPGNLSSAIVCRLKLRASADATRVRAETTAALAALGDPTSVRNTGRLWWGYTDAVNEATIRTTLAMEGLRGRTLARAELVHAGASALISEAFQAVAQTTVEEVSSFATRYLRGETSRSVLLISDRSQRPIGGGSGAIVPGVHVDAEPEPDGGDEGPPPLADLAAITRAPGAGAARVHTLKNGLTVIALRRPGRPFVAMRLGFHADPQPGDAPGAPNAIDVSLRAEVMTAPRQLGFLHSSKRDADSLQEWLTTLASNAGKALDLLSEAGDALQVVWPNPRFDRWADAAARVEATADDRAAHAFRTALLGDHAYQLRPPTDVIRKLTRAEAASWLARVRRPANGALVIVGDIDQEAAVRDADRALRGWKGDASSPPPPPAPPALPASPAPAPNVVHIDDPYRTSVALRFGCVLPAVRSPRDHLVHELLATAMENMLTQRLRGESSAGQAPHVGAVWLRGGSAWLEGTVDVDSKVAPQALAIVRGWFDHAQPFALDRKRLRTHTLAEGAAQRAVERHQRRARERDLRRLEHGLGAGGARRLPARSGGDHRGRSDRCVRCLPRAERDHRARRRADRLQLTA